MRELSDEQWEPIPKHFPEENLPENCPGREPVPSRKVLDGEIDSWSM